jgi:hypothetical protein
MVRNGRNKEFGYFLSENPLHRLTNITTNMRTVTENGALGVRDGGGGEAVKSSTPDVRLCLSI